MCEWCYLFIYYFLLQEIDAITTQPAQTDDATKEEPIAPAPTPPRPEPKTEQHSYSQNGSAQEFQYNTQYSLAGGEEINCQALISYVKANRKVQS